MPIPLPNLDDRRWADLVEQARAHIALYAPEWTDHNASDPGITLLELMAWVTEMDIYRLNRITPEQTRRLLALMDVRPEPPRAATVACALQIPHGQGPLRLSAGAQFAATDADGSGVLLRTRAPVDVIGASLMSVLRSDGTRMHNLTSAWQRGEHLALFGDDPAPGAALYLGFDQPLPQGVMTQLFLAIAGGAAGSREMDSGTQAHHSARLSWECLAGPGDWHGLEVLDETRCLTRSGEIRLRIDAAMQAAMLGPIGEARFWLRCRFAAGALDAAVQASSVMVNGVTLVQSVAVTSSWPIASGTVVTGTLTAGQRVALRIGIEHGAITGLEIVEDTAAPTLLVLAYEPPTDVIDGRLVIEGRLAGIGNGEPSQRFRLDQELVIESSVSLASVEQARYRTWKQVDDFAGSLRVDAHFHLDPARAVVTLGDGEQGRVLAPGCQLFACFETSVNNLSLSVIDGVADTPRNRAFDAGAIGAVRAGPALVLDAGAAAESLSHAVGRAVEAREARLRAVTAEDYEAIARTTPGLRVARAIARPNLYPGLDCVRAPGMVTLVVLPELPRGRPMPSPGFIARIAARIEARRTLGTRVVVTGPRYLRIAVRASVKALEGVSKNGLSSRVAQALDAFFDPLSGGPDADGWPLGRDVYRSEVMQVIDQAPGVDHVLALELIVDDCAPSCGNVCLRPTSLVDAGTHIIEVA